MYLDVPFGFALSLAAAVKEAHENQREIVGFILFTQDKSGFAVHSSFQDGEMALRILGRWDDVSSLMAQSLMEIIAKGGEAGSA